MKKKKNIDSDLRFREFLSLEKKDNTIERVTFSF